MRRFLTLTLALALAVAVRAELVRPDVAARYAQSVLGMKQTPSLQPDGIRRAASRDAQADPQYYIFNNPDGGWVIIAADDRVNPVIAYSDEGAFTTVGMPDNLKWWMDGVAESIDAVREEGASLSAREEWNNPLAETSGQQKVELKTALWDQMAPFNNLCPIVTGENVRSVTGCVATAMAIVMRYNRWPAKGKGVIGGYTTTKTSTYIPAYPIEDHVYNWDYMPMNNSIGADWTSEQKNEVAQLIHDCGVSVEMDYSSEASSSSSGKMLRAIQTNMSYSENSALVSRSLYTLDEWFAIIKREIDAGRVVYYAGDGDAGGHAFVCDGYDTDGSMLRINWGWSGSCNGFYTLDLFIPSDNYGFERNQEAVIGLAPDTANIVLDDVPSLVFIEHQGFYGITPVTPIDLVQGAQIKFKVGWIMNNSLKQENPEFRIRLEDKDGNIRQDGWYSKMKIPAADGYIYYDETKPIQLLVTPELTDHFKLYIKDAEGNWIPMRGNYDILPDVNGIICGVTQDPLIMVPDNCTAGQEIKLSLKEGFTPVQAVKWSVNGQELAGNSVVLVEGDNNIRADVEYLDDSTGSLFRTLTVE